MTTSKAVERVGLGLLLVFTAGLSVLLHDRMVAAPLRAQVAAC